MQELQKKYRFNFGISSTIFSTNLDDADNILAWARKEKLDIVFNMVRFTGAMLGNNELQGSFSPIGPEEQRMRSSSSTACGWIRCSTGRTTSTCTTPT